MKIKVLLFPVMILIASNVSAQFKIPGRKAVEKKAEKTANDIVNNTGKKSNDAPGTTIPAEETSGPAKSYINSFWKHIEKMKTHDNESNKQVVYNNGINAAKTALNNTKMKDPSYDTKEMEKTLAEYQSVYNGLGKSKQNLRDSRTATIEYMQQLITEPFIFTKGELQVNGDSTQLESAINNALAKSDAVINEHAEKVEEFLQTNPEEVMIKNNLRTAQIKAGIVPGSIKRAEEAYKNERSMSSVYYLQQLYLYRAYIAGALKIFPGDNSLQENHDLVVSAIERMGSRQGYMAKLKENYKEWAKNLKMGKAVMNDPSLEKLAKKEFEEWGSWDKMTVTRVTLASPWRLEKNSLDIPVKKEVYVNMAFKKPDGSCGLAVAYLVQEYEGGGKYGGAYMTMPSILAAVVPCENLK
jgi:hypothetical protein